LPEPSKLDRVEEPYIKATIITKSDFVGNVMSLCIEKRGEITNQTYLTTERVELNLTCLWQKLYLIFMID
jgi:GTP-binding protein LepA